MFPDKDKRDTQLLKDYYGHILKLLKVRVLLCQLRVEVTILIKLKSLPLGPSST